MYYHDGIVRTVAKNISSTNLGCTSTNMHSIPRKSGLKLRVNCGWNTSVGCTCGKSPHSSWCYRALEALPLLIESSHSFPWYSIVNKPVNGLFVQLSSHGLYLSMVHFFFSPWNYFLPLYPSPSGARLCSPPNAASRSLLTFSWLRQGCGQVYTKYRREGLDQWFHW